MKKFLVLILMCIYSSISQANFTIAPVNLKINKNNKIGEINLTNEGDVAKNFQLILYKVEYKNGKEVLKETNDLRATPKMFRVKAGRTQLIRVALQNKDSYSTENNGYRIAVKELPHKQEGMQAQVKFIMEFRVPITVGQ